NPDGSGDCSVSPVLRCELRGGHHLYCTTSDALPRPRRRPPPLSHRVGERDGVRGLCVAPAPSPLPSPPHGGREGAGYAQLSEDRNEASRKVNGGSRGHGHYRLAFHLGSSLGQGLDTFLRWLDDPEIPEKTPTWYLRGEVWVDLSLEHLFTHLGV